MECVGDLDPLHPRVPEHPRPLFIETRLADQHFHCDPGPQQHFQLVRHHIDQGVRGGQPRKHGENGYLHILTCFPIRSPAAAIPELLQLVPENNLQPGHRIDHGFH